jgi:hypothetical protein
VLMPLLGNVFRRSVPGFPASLLSLTTTDVVLSKENHMQLIEVTTLDRKSGGAERSAVSISRPSLCRKEPKGTHGLAFETWDPRNLSRR